MELSLHGKSAVVTGASGGLGLHFAEVLARAGAEVTIAARRKEKLEEAAARFKAEGLKIETATLDVTDEASINALFAKHIFDVTINNAGITGSGMAMDMTPEVWDQVMDTNLRGSFLVAQAAARGLKAAGKGGAIVNIGSILGERVGGAVLAYTSSKAAVIQMSKAMALEWARFGIRVNALCPGYFETDLNGDFFASPAGQALVNRIPMRRLGRPQELDGALLLLASDAGSFITGSALTVDGGHLVSTL